MKLALLGDIALFGNLSLKNNKGASEYFKEVASYLSTVDLVVGNFESPFSAKKKTYGAKSAYLYSDPENIEILKYLHLDIANLANNHTFDYGKEGLNLTKQILSENGIDYFGVDGKEVTVENNGTKLAFSGFCCYTSGPNGCVEYGKPGINEYNLKNASDIIERYHKNGYLNIISVHAGTEHVNYPSIETIKAAKYLANKVPIIYYGHHPHVAQGIEEDKGSLIAYSLGNFCFDDVYSSVSSKPLIELSENNRSSFILEVTIEENKVKSHQVIPIYIGKDKMTFGRGVTEEVINSYTDNIYKMSEKDYTSYRNKLIQSYLSDRISKRDLMWYLKRLRPRYLKILINAKKRSLKYKESVLTYININK